MVVVFELGSALIDQLGMSIPAGKTTAGNSALQGLGRISQHELPR